MNKAEDNHYSFFSHDRQGSVKRKLSSSPPSSSGGDGCHPSSLWGSRNRDEAVSSNSSSSNGDRMIAEDMLNLTLEERQKVYEQVHGVDQVLEETEELIAQGLDQMAKELAKKRKKNDHPAMDKVAFLRPSRLKDKDLLLMFLRYDDFDGRKAGQRLMVFFDFLYEYFGLEGLLADRLTMKEHLTERDREFLRLGSVRPLPNITDRSGRPILLYPGLRCPHSYEDLVPAHTYICMSLLQSCRAAQTRGVVGVIWRVGVHGRQGYVSKVTPSVIRACSAFFRAIPLKLSATHFCSDNRKFQRAFEMAKIVIGRDNRVRFRSHFGSSLECRYQLMSFGVDVSKFPVGVEDEILLEPYHQYLDSLETQERILAADGDRQPRIIVPRPTDVLLGRGKPFREYPGNQRLSQLVRDCWEEYNALDVHQKTVYTWSYTTDLLQQGVRFLKRKHEDDEWQQVSQEECVKKVVTTFRNKPYIQRYHVERFWQGKQGSQIIAADDDDQNDDEHDDFLDA